MKKPDIIVSREAELMALLTANNKPYLTVEPVAAFMGIDPHTLRLMICSRQCSFGYGIDSRMIPGKKNSYARVDKLAFWYFMMGVAG